MSLPKVTCRLAICAYKLASVSLFLFFSNFPLHYASAYTAYLVMLTFQSLRSLLGEELAEFLESGENENRLDDVRSRMRLLRDLRVDTRARGMWARLLNDQPASRRHKSGSKKGGSTSRSGCFGHKMDRIGTISGMGC